MQRVRPGIVSVSVSVILVSLIAAYLGALRGPAKDLPEGTEIPPRGAEEQVDAISSQENLIHVPSGSSDSARRHESTSSPSAGLPPSARQDQPTLADPPALIRLRPRPGREVIYVQVEAEQVASKAGKGDAQQVHP